jgi:UDPglucose 6-dehydrogenase
MIKESVGGYEHVKICRDFKEAFNGTDAIVITTDWDEFKKIDYIGMAKNMRTRIIIDTKNMLDVNAFRGSGIKYYGIGVTHE